jgi:uncharacterized protein YidB (DUF937 family)
MESGVGLLDQVLNQVLAPQQTATGSAPSGIAGVLMNVLSGGGSGQAGGLAGLISRFQQAGLGHIAGSWVGNGPNQSVTPEQLQSVFGEDQVQKMARQADMPPHHFLAALSQHLPRVVDGMTPNGQLPEEGTVSV